MAAKARLAAAVAPTRGQVGRRETQMKPAKTRANRLMESDSDSSDRFHIATGRVVANPRITNTAVTLRQPGSTSRPTVQASPPQHRAAITAWVVTTADGPPAALINSGVSGGRGPANRARDQIGRRAMDA